MVSTTDHEKFDDVIRMILSGDITKRQKLETYLNPLHGERKINFGIHVSEKAHMTCLVFQRNGKQVHFIDGADGGYALAKSLKERSL